MKHILETSGNNALKNNKKMQAKVIWLLVLGINLFIFYGK